MYYYVLRTIALYLLMVGCPMVSFHVSLVYPLSRRYWSPTFQFQSTWHWQSRLKYTSGNSAPSREYKVTHSHVGISLCRLWRVIEKGLVQSSAHLTWKSIFVSSWNMYRFRNVKNVVVSEMKTSMCIASSWLTWLRTSGRSQSEAPDDRDF